MIVEHQILENVLLLKPNIYKDERGYFFESFRESIFKKNGYNIKFVQDNEVLSRHSGIIRGLHYQLKNPQGKLVNVVAGAITDVIVDIRTGSPDFGKSIMINLDSAAHNMVYIPEGYAHGYLVLKEDTIVQYKCTNYYDPTSEYGIKWNDESIGLQWNYDSPIISKRDLSLPALKDQQFLPKY